MSQTQRLMLTARQAGDQAQRLLAWLEHGRLDRPEFAGLINDVESVVGSIGRVIEAVEKRPAIAVVGAHGSGKTLLLSMLCGSPDQPVRAEFSNREASLDVMASVMPASGGSRASAAIRLSTAESAAAPRGFPVRVKLLGQLDLVRLLFRAHASHLGVAVGRTPTARAVAHSFAEAERHMQPRAVAGFSARDIVDLRDDVHGFDPRSPLLRSLAAAGYWDRLAVAVAHLPESQRTTLLAHLWNDEPAFTAIYTALAAALEKLGHAADVYCETEAIVAREPATGWMVPHRTSIVAATTLDGLAHAVGPITGSTVQVSGRFGGSIAIDRALMAALISELPLRLTVPPVQGLGETDVLTFPGAPAIADFARPSRAQATGSSATAADGGGLGLEAAASLFAQAKPGFLIERATRRHEIVSLVSCLDPSQPQDDIFASAIGDWIDITQGAEPHHRERVSTGLFVVVTQPLAAGDVTSRIEPWAAAAKDARIRNYLTEGFGFEQDWPLEWTPSRPFENIFAFHRPARGLATRRTGDGHLRLVPASAGGSIMQGAASLPASAATSSQGLGADPLLRALGAVSSRTLRDRQLFLHLAELRRCLRSRVLRHHLSNDPLEIAEWRRRVTNVAVNRLKKPGLASRANGVPVGTLVSALAPAEAECMAVIEALAAARGWSTSAVYEHRVGDYGASLEAIAHKPGSDRPPASLVAPETSSIGHDIAAAAAAYWIGAMRQAGRSTRFCRHLGAPQTVLQHMIDEIAIGAGRTGLVSQLAESCARSIDHRRSGQIPVGQVAASCAQFIGTYLARMPSPTPSTMLGPGAHLIPESSSASATGWMSGALPTVLSNVQNEQGEGRYSVGIARRMGERPMTFGGDKWASAYAGLVEANIAAVSGLIGAAERDRELGELLMGFASSPFEVEL